MKQTAHYLNVFLLCLASLLFFGFGLKFIGSITFGLGVVSLLFCEEKFEHDLFLLYIAVSILAITPVSTSITYGHILIMVIGLFSALFIPYSLSRVVYKENIIHFFFNHKKKWSINEILYLFGVIAVTYLLVPVFLIPTGVYHNWSVELNPDGLFRLFLGVNLMGAWDELFFIFTVFAFLKRFFSFTVANIAQAILFSSFLYELGFHGWGIIVVFVFTFLQGVVFVKTKSIAYILTIHLAVDMILYLVLIHAYFPNILPIFLTG